MQQVMGDCSRMNPISSQGFDGFWGPADGKPKWSPEKFSPQPGEPSFAYFKVIPDGAALAKTVDGGEHWRM